MSSHDILCCLRQLPVILVSKNAKPQISQYLLKTTTTTTHPFNVLSPEPPVKAGTRKLKPFMILTRVQDDRVAAKPYANNLHFAQDM